MAMMAITTRSSINVNAERRTTLMVNPPGERCYKARRDDSGRAMFIFLSTHARQSIQDQLILQEQMDCLTDLPDFDLTISRER